MSLMSVTIKTHNDSMEICEPNHLHNLFIMYLYTVLCCHINIELVLPNHLGTLMTLVKQTMLSVRVWEKPISMEKRKSYTPLQIIICNDIDSEHNYGATLQSRSGAWVWLIIILVIVSCTDLFLYFLHLFSNLVAVFFIPVQRSCPCTFYTCSTLYPFKFLKKNFICLVRNSC